MKVMIYQDPHDDNMYHIAMPYQGFSKTTMLYHFAAIHRDAINDIGGNELIAQLDAYKSGELIEVNLTIQVEE